MKIISRRQWVGLASVGLAAGLAGKLVYGESVGGLRLAQQPLSLSELELAGIGPMRERFLGWLRTGAVTRERAVRNLVFNFFDVKQGKGSWIYPMLSGKAILWLVQQGHVAEATAIATTLVRWQQTSREGPLAKSYGAFCSKLEERAGKWEQGERYYSGDNLVILEALVALYEKTKDPDLLNSAIGVGTWLTQVMCKGREAGLWAEDHGAPMYFVTKSGDFSNEIYSSVEMLWIGALHRLGRVAREPAYARQAEKAFAFYRGAQAANGAFLDRYDPGFPAVPYNAGRWKPYQPGQVIGDNLLRSALGAVRFGEIASARRFFEFLKTESGAVPAYVDLATGSSGFPAGQRVYYDLTSSALHRSLAQWLGERKAAEDDIAFLKKNQHPGGGWYWGLFKDTNEPVDSQLAPVVGFWATADLSVPVI